MKLKEFKCKNCGGELMFGEAAKMYVCINCNTPYVYDAMPDGVLDADTMFENWLVSRDAKLKEDFRYYYATDERCWYMETCRNVYDGNIVKLRSFILNFFTGPRFGKYLETEMDMVDKLYNEYLGRQREKKEQEEERRRLEEEKERDTKRRMEAERSRREAEKRKREQEEIERIEREHAKNVREFVFGTLNVLVYVIAIAMLRHAYLYSGYTFWDLIGLAFIQFVFISISKWVMKFFAKLGGYEA